MLDGGLDRNAQRARGHVEWTIAGACLGCDRGRYCRRRSPARAPGAVIGRERPSPAAIDDS
jgi:hypothetical protein